MATQAASATEDQVSAHTLNETQWTRINDDKVSFKVHESGRTPLLIAAMSGDVDQVRALDVADRSMNALDKNGYTPLSNAVGLSHELALRTLIAAGADLEAVKSSYRGTPLLCATGFGNSDAVAILLEAGASIEAPNDKSETALACAARCGRDDIVWKLVQAGANLEAKTYYGDTCLSVFAAKSNNDLIRFLIDKGASVDTMNRTHQTPLMIATAYNKIDCVRMLIAAGANLNIVNVHGHTALGRAVVLGHLPIVRLLIRSGANVEARARGKDTPLLLAAKSDHSQALEIARVLIEAGASMSATAAPESLKTALHVAAKHNRPCLVDTLIHSGANLEARDENGFKPIELAGRSGNVRVVRVLITAGALVGPRNYSSDTIVEQRKPNTQASAICQKDLTSRKTSSVRSLFFRWQSQNPLIDKASSTMQIGEVDLIQEATSPEAKPKNMENHGNSALLRDARSLCCNVKKFLMACKRGRDLFGSTKRNGDGLAATLRAWCTLRSLLESNPDMNPVMRFLILPSVRTFCAELLDWTDNILQINSDIRGQQQIISDIEAQKHMVMEFVRSNHTTSYTSTNSAPIIDELELLSYECDQQKSKYTAEERYLMHKYLQRASRTVQIEIEKTPKWFIPLYDIDLDGACSWVDEHSIRCGLWRGLPVTTETVDYQPMDTFKGNIATRFSLKHPHVIDLKGAFHLCRPPVVVYGSYRSLAEFLVDHLSAKNSISDSDFAKVVWQKLYETSLGLAYLHNKGFAHGNLSPRHLVVDQSGVGQIVYLLSSNPAENEAAGKSSNCVVSDVHDFGMTFLEILSLLELHRSATKTKSKPPYIPSSFVIGYWSLIEAMCATNPSFRITMEHVVDRMHYLLRESP